MKVIAVGGRSFVTGFRLAGVSGLVTGSPEEALRTVTRMMSERDLGLILIGDDVAKPIRAQLSRMRSKKAVPVLFEVPAPGSKAEKIEYMTLLKQILGV